MYRGHSVTHHRSGVQIWQSDETVLKLASASYKIVTVNTEGFVDTFSWLAKSRKAAGRELQKLMLRGIRPDVRVPDETWTIESL